MIYVRCGMITPWMRDGGRFAETCATSGTCQPGVSRLGCEGSTILAKRSALEITPSTRACRREGARSFVWGGFVQRDHPRCRLGVRCGGSIGSMLRLAYSPGDLVCGTTCRPSEGPSLDLEDEGRAPYLRENFSSVLRSFVSGYAFPLFVTLPELIAIPARGATSTTSERACTV